MPAPRPPPPAVRYSTCGHRRISTGSSAALTPALPCPQAVGDGVGVDITVGVGAAVATSAAFASIVASAAAARASIVALIAA